MVLEISTGKIFFTTFFARCYFYARADLDSRNAAIAERLRLRVITLEEVKVKELLYLRVFVWSPRSEI